MSDVAATDNPAECSCCGGDYAEADLVRLTAHPEVGICTGCVDGLAARRPGLVRATPVLATDDLAASAAFWRTAGFDVSVFGPTSPPPTGIRSSCTWWGRRRGATAAPRTSTHGASTGSTTSGRPPNSR